MMLQMVSITSELRALMTPLHPISRGRLRVLYPPSLKSPANLSYLAVFLSNAAWKELEESHGTVSSTSITLVGITDLSMMTKSGICSVSTMSGGKVPPFTLQPFRSAYTVTSSFLCFTIVVRRWDNTESWRYLNRSSS